MSQRRRIALIAGDGVGPEVMRPAERLLEWYRDARGFEIDLWSLPLGAESWLEDGTGLTQATLFEIRESCGAVLLGALGDPRIPDQAHARQILFGLRQGLDLYANLRPARALVDRIVPLSGRRRSDVDILVWRENTEGAYSGVGRQIDRGEPSEVGIEEDVNTRRGVERILRAAFQHAKAREKRLCMTDKSNALRYAHDLWQRVYQELLLEYPDVAAEHVYVDALCHELVRDPARFEVIVAPNLLGDIVSDLTAALAGGLGLAPSANLCLEGQGPGLFEPVHGSAPSLAGRDRANPMAMLRSVGMMLEWLGWPREREAIDRACADALGARECTPDVGGTLGTQATADAVFKRIQRESSRHGP